jgi:hypothetical protein
MMGMILVMASLDMLCVASSLPFMAVLANTELAQTNVVLDNACSLSGHIGIYTNKKFLFTLGLLVLVLLLASFALMALATYAQTCFALIREYSIGKRLVEGFIHQSYGWLLSRHIEDMDKTIFSEVDNLHGYATQRICDRLSIL